MRIVTTHLQQASKCKIGFKLTFQLIITECPTVMEEAAFISLQPPLSSQVFKINANVQGIIKLIDHWQLGTPQD